MGKKIENNSNKFLEDYLGISDLVFNEDICEDRNVYFGKHIKRGGNYRKETEITYSFPKYISCIFTKGRQKYGIKFNTKDSIVDETYKYESEDTVDVGDGFIQMETSFFGKRKPMLLPYLFVGTKYKMDINKVANFLKEKINHQ